ncbi:MAG TPA: amino acid adenylation domain-containing protein [Methylomirabilota bacterium]|nr:amino acid adenylation domain-containing protein [Methylomirabilota bacterium]
MPGGTPATRLQPGARADRTVRRGPTSIPRASRSRPLPLSFAQQQILLHAQLAPGLPLYNEAVTLRYRGVLDRGATARALASLIARHEAWRTVFRVEDDRPVQIVLPPGPVQLPAHDVRGLHAAAREPEAIRLATADALAPFDLTTGPLLRARLVQVDDDDARLYMTLHHVIFDGYSLYQIVVPELAALYRAATDTAAHAMLPEPPLQYADWAVWQRGELERGAWARQLEFWRKQLGGDLPRLDVADRPRPPVQSYRGRTHTFTLPAALAARLKSVSRDERASLYMTLLAAFFALLQRYTGENDLLIGSVSAGRKLPDVASLLGFFANPIALRATAGDDPSFRTLLRRVRDVTLDALSNDDVPFEHIVAALQPARDPGRHPFYQIVFALEAPLATLPERWDLRHLDVDTGTAKFDLYLEMNDRPDGLGGRFVYAVDLFEPTTIERMARHYANILTAIVEDPGVRLSALPMLGPGELRQVLVDFAQAPPAFPATETVHGRVASHAARTPDAVAIVDGARQLTYRALQAQAAGVAARLRALGVGRDSVVGVYAGRSADTIAAYLGVLQTGAAYLPLDPAYPRPRLAMMLQDAAVRVVLADRRAPLLHAPGVTRLWLDEPADPTGGPAAHALDAVAYVLFTSGSTGRPKGVMVPHHGILRLVFGQSYAQLGPGETVLHLATPVFDAATFEIWGALLHGARCVVHPPGVPTPRTLRELIGAHGVTTLLFTTSMFNLVVDEDATALRGVRQVLVGGEALSPRHMARAAAALPGVRFVNVYGPTEATTFAACHPIPLPIDPAAPSIPIGRPIAGTEIYLLDEHRQPVPVGVAGELYIGGAGVARGYVNRPELTAERFVAHPFRADDDARLYRSGDRARWRPDGTLDFLGRRDGQVKVRGVRVELGEIEAVLTSHEAVREAAVIAADGPGGDRMLVAYVVAEAGAAPEPTALRAFLQARLPAAFVPARVMPVPALPLMPNGKLDRRALPAVDPSRDRVAAAPARGPLKRQLALVWAELLGLPSVGADEDFFELGGHSLLAVRMLQRVQQLYGITLPLAALYGHPTIEGLADALLRHDAAAYRSPMIKLREGTGAPLFFFHGDLNGGGFYCKKLARTLPGPRAVWVVHPLGIDGGPVPPSIEAMARQHAADIVAAAPEGAIVLGGYCNGALVAWETARVLTARGRTVERVIVVAADADTRFARLRRPLTLLARLAGASTAAAMQQFARLRFFAARVRASRGHDGVALAARSIAHVASQLAHALRPRGAHGAAPARTFDRYFSLVMSYVPGPWPGHLVVFWPGAERAARPGDPTLGWGALAATVEVHVVPGDHDEIVTRHIARIAELLGPHL